MSAIHHAFPTPMTDSTKGMSLRDYFAAQVAAGDAAADGGWGDVTAEQAVERARVYYSIADAMMQVRAEGAGTMQEYLDDRKKP